MDCWENILEREPSACPRMKLQLCKIQILIPKHDDRAVILAEFSCKTVSQVQRTICQLPCGLTDLLPLTEHIWRRVPVSVDLHSALAVLL